MVESTVKTVLVNEEFLHEYLKYVRACNGSKDILAPADGTTKLVTTEGEVARIVEDGWSHIDDDTLLAISLSELDLIVLADKIAKSRSAVWHCHWHDTFGEWLLSGQREHRYRN